MRRNLRNKAQSVIEYAFVVVAITAAFIVMSKYVQNTVDSNLAKLEGKEGNEKVYCNPDDPCAANACRPDDCLSDDPCAPNAREPAPELYCAYPDCTQQPCAIVTSDPRYYCEQECDDCKATGLGATGPGDACKEYFRPQAEDVCDQEALQTCSNLTASACRSLATKPISEGGGGCVCGTYDCQSQCCDKCPTSSNCQPGLGQAPRLGFYLASASFVQQGSSSFMLADKEGDECYSDCMSSSRSISACKNDFVNSCIYSCEGLEITSGVVEYLNCTPLNSTPYIVGVFEDCMRAYLFSNIPGQNSPRTTCIIYQLEQDYVDNFKDDIDQCITDCCTLCSTDCKVELADNPYCEYYQ